MNLDSALAQGLPSFGPLSLLSSARPVAADDKAVGPVPSGPTQPADAKEEASLLERYHNPFFKYDDGARRLVMVLRDPETGETVEQVPPETVLRNYEESLRRVQRELRESGVNDSEASNTLILYPSGIALRSLGDGGPDAPTPEPGEVDGAAGAEGGGLKSGGSGQAIQFNVAATASGAEFGTGSGGQVNLLV